MASGDLGLNDAKLAWGNWDYVDLSHFTKMPGTSITASALSLMKGCGVKAQHPGVLAGVASFSAGIALHRMKRSHGKRSNACGDIMSRPLPTQEIRKDGSGREERLWLPVVLKAAGATCLICAASRKIRKRWKTALAERKMKLSAPVKSAIALDGAPAPNPAMFSKSHDSNAGRAQDSLKSVSTKAPLTTNNTVTSYASMTRGRAPYRSLGTRRGLDKNHKNHEALAKQFGHERLLRNIWPRSITSSILVANDSKGVLPALWFLDPGCDRVPLCHCCRAVCALWSHCASRPPLP